MESLRENHLMHSLRENRLMENYLMENRLMENRLMENRLMGNRLLLVILRIELLPAVILFLNTVYI
jgi:hypothetical protein